MKCLSPVHVKNVGCVSDYHMHAVPCGKCPPCVQRKAQGWALRLSNELQVSTAAQFITLTYSDDNIPETPSGNYTLVKRDHQLFMKRLRKRIPKKMRLGYYMVGEYGGQTMRPHYHSILFNLATKSPIDDVHEAWQLGAVHMGEVTEASINYVTGYLSKVPPDLMGDQQKQFNMMSKKLGASYLTPDRIKYYQENLHPYLITNGGQKAPMPRYYRNKIYTEDQLKKVNQKALEFIQENELDPKTEYELGKKAVQKRDRDNHSKRLSI